MARRKNLFLPERRWTSARLLKWLIACLLLAIAVAAGWMAYFALTPVQVPPQGREFNINQGSSLRATARRFEQTGLIRERHSFILLARGMGLADKIKAG